MDKKLSVSAVLIWMAIIFFFSHQPGNKSGELSDGVTAIIIDMIGAVFPGAGDYITGFMIRKTAHFMVYLVLGILLMNACRSFGIRGTKSILIAFILSVLYAASDEFHQSFIPGRGPQVTDVLIDSAGALVGIGFYWGFVKMIGRKFKGAST